MDITMDMAMGLATGIIDMLMEIQERINPGMSENTNTQRLREDTLLKTTMLHGEQMGDAPETKEEAQSMLRGLMEDGTVDRAFGYVNRRANEEGLNVDDMMRRGNEMLTGQRRPVTGAIEEALMPQPQGGPHG